MAEYQDKADSAEEARRKIEKQLNDAQREITTRLRAQEDAERQIRRLEDKIRGLETEKEATENARKLLEEELRRLQQYEL